MSTFQPYLKCKSMQVMYENVVRCEPIHRPSVNICSQDPLETLHFVLVYADKSQPLLNVFRSSLAISSSLARDLRTAALRPKSS